MAASPSEMVRLDAPRRRAVFEAYRREPAFFPLVGTVLEGTQDGSAWGDDAAHPTQVYVEHAFGFAQVIGGRVAAFEEALQKYLLAERRFAPAKVRLYTPQLPPFLAGPAGAGLRSERQRFRLAAAVVEAAPAPAPDWQAVAIDAANFDAMEAAFGVALRFWRSREDFITGARATVAVVAGRPAAICYAAAVSGARAEIDVLTLPACRQRGAGRFAVAQFVRRCRAEGIEPLWDCFTNNTGSMELCRAAGFRAAAPAYPFFTLAK